MKQVVRCSAETGTIKTGWRVCLKPAVVASERNFLTDYLHTLHYCSQHAARAYKAEGSIRVVRVYELKGAGA